MYKIETENHIIETSENEKPAFTCTGKCKSVWWMNSFPEYNPLEIIYCPKCKGNLRTTKQEDYKIIEFKITNENKTGIKLIHEVKKVWETTPKFGCH